GGSAKVLGELGKSADGLAAHLKGLGGKGARAVADLALGLPVDSRQSQEFVRKYVDAAVIKQVKPEEKVTFLKMLSHSPTSKADERSILRLLNSAKDVNELKTLVEGAGKSWLGKKLDDAKIQKAVESKIFEVEKAEAPPWPDGDVDLKNVDAKLEH